MAKIDLTAFEWRELIFQGRNKNYGAYQLRSDSSRRHWRALIYITIFALIAFNLPGFIKFVTPEKGDEDMTEVVTMTKLPEKTVEVEQKMDRPVTVEPPPIVKSSIQFTKPEIKDDDKVSAESEIKSQETLASSNLAISTADVKNGDDAGQLIEDVKVAVTQAEPPPFDIVEQMPTYPGGDGELMKFLSTNIKYPPIALENGIEGKVIVRFVVNRSGEVDRAEVVRSLDPSCDREALRVVNLMKGKYKWVPGKQNGENVPVWFTLPVTFRLTK
jgi:protein TonB